MYALSLDVIDFKLDVTTFATVWKPDDESTTTTEQHVHATHQSNDATNAIDQSDDGSNAIDQSDDETNAIDQWDDATDAISQSNATDEHDGHATSFPGNDDSTETNEPNTRGKWMSLFS